MSPPCPHKMLPWAFAKVAHIRNRHWSEVLAVQTLFKKSRNNILIMSHCIPRVGAKAFIEYNVLEFILAVHFLKVQIHVHTDERTFL